jgi:hypothetical protein
MPALDLSRLVPGDAAAALRSYPRRYREAVEPISDDEDVDELAHRVGPDGRSAIDVVSDVTRTWVVLREGLRQITVADTPVLHPAVVDPAQRQWEMPPPDSVDETLALLSDEAQAFAEAVDRVSAPSWARSGSVPGGERTTALDLAREAVQVGRDGLTAVESALHAARR